MKQGWQVKKLSDVGKVYNGNSINEKVKKDKYIDLDDGFPYIATKDVSYDSVIEYENSVKIPFEEKSQFKIAPSGTVLICAEGGSAGRKIAFTNQDVCFGNKLFAFSSNKSIEGRYVYYYFFSPIFQMQFLGKMTGIIGGISMNKFKDITISFPQIPDQQRIVAILDEAFEAIDKAKANAEQNLINAKELFKSYMEQIFENKAEHWENISLEKLCDSNRTITYGVIKLGDEISDGVPCLRTSNVRWLRIETEGMKRISPQLSMDYSRTILHGGEVLVNVRGTLGGIAVVSKEMAGWNISREVAMVPVDNSKVNPSFLAYFIGSTVSQKWLGGMKKGAAYVGINLEDLRLLPISLPKIEEQLEIVKKIQSIQEETHKLVDIYETKINYLEELKKSILQKAFNGEL